jgi:cell division protein ZapA
MSNLNLQIGGREYTVACAEGEEAHVSGLGRMIDAKLSAMGNASGSSETRTLLFAALLLADELHDLQSSGVPAASTAQPQIAADRLEAIAAKLENLVSHLEA